MGISCCGCGERKENIYHKKTDDNSKEILKQLLSSMDERPERHPLAEMYSFIKYSGNTKHLNEINFENDPGLIDVLGIANEYWRNSHLKPYEENMAKTFIYQICGLIRGEKHIYTVPVSTYES